MNRITTIGTAFVFSAFIGACGGSEADDSAAAAASETPPAAEEMAAGEQVPGLPAGVTTVMVAEGDALFNSRGCTACHGPGGMGTPLAPNLTDDTWLNIDGTYEAIVNLVDTGVSAPKEHPGVMLPRGGTGITDEEMNKVAAYVWTLSHSM